MSTPDPPKAPRPGSTLLWFAAWVVAYFAARGALERTGPSGGWAIGIAAAPVPLFALCLLAFVRYVRRLDELDRLIHLEALAVAFPLAVLLLMTLGLLQRAVVLSADDWSYAHVWVFLPLFYLFGLALARRRYR